MINLEIDLYDETEIVDEQTLREIEKLIVFTANELIIENDSEISITLVDNKRIHELNMEYRGKDAPTDVISFALEEMGEGEIPVIGGQGPVHLGDIIISVDKAKEQAEEYGHSFKREIGFLAVHGFLHLVGYDHMTEEEEKKMFAKQKEILDAYGLKR